jgi:CheY-like chemotaxis protein
MTGRPRVLLAEDDALMAALLSETLEELGYEVCHVASTETDAVLSATRYKPDLMLVDATLGTGSGVAAVNQILREIYIPHVFISGETLRTSNFPHAAIFLQKPFRETELVDAIGRALSRAP